jgi:hypothetical protein
LITLQGRICLPNSARTPVSTKRKSEREKKYIKIRKCVDRKEESRGVRRRVRRGGGTK